MYMLSMDSNYEGVSLVSSELYFSSSLCKRFLANSRPPIPKEIAKATANAPKIIINAELTIEGAMPS